MMSVVRWLKRLKISRCVIRYKHLTLVSSAFVLLAFLIYNCSHSKLLGNQILDVPDVTTELTGHINTVSFTYEDLKKASINSGAFLATMSKNLGKTSGSAVCVVDPAIADCGGMGFAAFLLYTLDQIIFCRALGINQPTVLWRACNSVCSQDPKVNSWNWYFEPVNHGLESKVEKVLCLLKIDDIRADRLDNLKKTSDVDITSILDNSFRDRTDVKGYEKSKIITTHERIRVNELISQHVKPNSRIREKVMMFHRRYLEGFTVLGVQVRGTDHWRETSEQRLPSLMSWVKRAQEILETLPRPRKIFIASDNNEIIEKFVNVFGVKTVSLSSLLLIFLLFIFHANVFSDKF